MMTQAQALQRAAQHFRAYEKGAMGDDSFTELAEMCEEVVASRPFQVRVDAWIIECFNMEIRSDAQERNHRFLEEGLELVQACGCTVVQAHQLVDYVFSRRAGDKSQEVGGVLLTLAALCNVQGLGMGEEAERELDRVLQPEVMVKIRAKQAAKPKMSPLPQ